MIRINTEPPGAAVITEKRRDVNETHLKEIA